MKDSEITVTMKMSTFKELERYREMFFDFRKKFKDCFEDSNKPGVDQRLVISKVIGLGKSMGIVMARPNPNLEIALDE